MGESKGAPKVAQFDMDMANEAVDPNLGDHKLVDAIDFKHLETCTKSLEKNIAKHQQKFNGFDNACKEFACQIA